MKYEYDWSPEFGVATCTIQDHDLIFTGSARCHPDDEDMKNHLSGQTIAEARASIKYLKHIRDNELRPQLKILKQLYYSMNRSKHFDRKSYEAKMLFRQINRITKDIENINHDINTLKIMINTYIDQKDEEYKKIRAHRAAKNNQ